MNMRGVIEVCGLKLGPWKNGRFALSPSFEKFVFEKGDHLRHLKVRLTSLPDEWVFQTWDELEYLNGPLNQCKISMSLPTDEVLKIADETLERFGKLGIFQ
jgi:hypothetical protein